LIQGNTNLNNSEKTAIMTGQYGYTIKQLREMMEARNAEALEKYVENGGAAGIAKRLKTCVDKGIHGDIAEEIQSRQNAFDVNYIPPKKPKSFWELAWEAMQDLTLIILIICAFISIALATIQFISHQNSGPTEDKQCEAIDPDGSSLSESTSQSRSGEEVQISWVTKYAEFIEGFAILFAIMIVVFVTAWNDWSKEKQFRGLQDKISEEQTCSVIRNGESLEIVVAELVVGDVVQVKYGDLLPADGMIIQSNDLKVDESSLTGESDHVKKSTTRDPALLGGTHVMEGSGKMIVTAVGCNSQSGIIFTLLGAADESQLNQGNRDAESTPLKNGDIEMGNVASQVEEEEEEEEEQRSILQMKLDKLTVQIGYMGMIFMILTIVGMLGQLLIRIALTDVWDPNHEQWETINSTQPDDTRLPMGECFSPYFKVLMKAFILGITVLVVAVPEGLPLAVTISLAYSVKKMMNDNNLVRHLDACETMGNATAICSDKTGTLTTNRMTVVQSFIGGKFFQDCAPDINQFPENIQNLLVTGIAVNSNYTSKIIPASQVGGQDEQIGNKTECALLGFVLQLKRSYMSVRNAIPETMFQKVFTFNSARKSMSTIIPIEDGKKYRMYTKGASEIVLSKCVSVLDANGEPVHFSIQDRKNLQDKVIASMANNALRTIALAYKDIDVDTDLEDEDKMIRGLNLVAIVGIEDPVRPEVPAAIQQCQKAGIMVRMVTGDNLVTAHSIAKKCGIIESTDVDALVMDGKEFNRRIRDSEGNIQQSLLDKVWPNLKVLARSSPTDKHTLVKGMIDADLRSQGIGQQVVAVTGDGTNDGPALKKADVGFAMGIAGTDVAKEASDIILTDDNFTSIVKAVQWGRNVYDSISKFLQFQLTVNVVAVVVAFIGATFTGDSPLKAVQMLWVNLIMDTFASLALATEPPTPDLLNRMPYSRNQPLISKRMAVNILGHAAYQMVMIFGMLWGPSLVPCYKQCWTSEDPKNISQVATTVFQIGVAPNDKWDGGVANPSEHFTVIFNAFVMMQIFNEINARKIHGERSVFKGIFDNPLFYGIVIGTLVTQVLIIEMAGVVFACTSLSVAQWMFCTCVGLFELIWQQFICFVPDTVLDSCFAPKTLPAPKVQSDGGTTVQSQQHEYENQVPEVSAAASNRGQVLWFRGLNRIQQQRSLCRKYSEHRSLSTMSTDSILKLTNSVARLAKTNGDAQAKEMIFEQIGINENEAHPLVMKAIDKTLSSSRVNIE